MIKAGNRGGFMDFFFGWVLPGIMFGAFALFLGPSTPAGTIAGAIVFAAVIISRKNS